jgi:hypothetical protein
MSFLFICSVVLSSHVMVEHGQVFSLTSMRLTEVYELLMGPCKSQSWNSYHFTKSAMLILYQDIIHIPGTFWFAVVKLNMIDRNDMFGDG